MIYIPVYSLAEEYERQYIQICLRRVEDSIFINYMSISFLLSKIYSKNLQKYMAWIYCTDE